MRQRHRDHDLKLVYSLFGLREPLMYDFIEPVQLQLRKLPHYASLRPFSAHLDIENEKVITQVSQPRYIPLSHDR